MSLDIHGQFDFGGTPQALAQNLFLDFELVVVAGVLIVASAAGAEVWARRPDSVRRRFDDRCSMGANKSGLLLGDGGFYFFATQNEWNERSFAASTRIGWQVGQAIAAIDQLFNSKEQPAILNEGAKGPGLQQRRMPRPIGN